ncbi:MAG: apolipoprotein N-acyltransferase [Nanobdellota archaeon]
MNKYALTIISGILLILSFPPFDFHFLVWVALAPFLYALLNTSFVPKKRFGIKYTESHILGLLLGIVFYYGTLYWIYNIFQLFGLILILILCLFIMFYGLILNYIVSKTKNRFSLIVFPAILWVSIEYIRSELWWLKFSWMSLGYSQHNFLPLLQFANLFGQYGLSFLIVLVNSIIVYIIINKHDNKLVFKSIVGLVVIFGLVFSYGSYTLQTEYSPDINVGLVQDESSQLETYRELINNLPRDTNFILLPEYAVPVIIEESPEIQKRLSDISVDTDAYLIVGAKDRAEEYSGKADIMRRQGYSAYEIDRLLKVHNTAYLFSPDGDIVGKYNKMNPIQFLIDGVPGKNFSVFPTDFAKIGIMICYDADYSYVARNLVKNGAQIIFVPTYDAMRWSTLQHIQHSAMTSMRAVENGRFIARAASSGISQIIDPHGRELYSIRIGESGIVSGKVQAIDKNTFYTTGGHLLSKSMLVFSAMFLLYFLLPSRFNFLKKLHFYNRISYLFLRDKKVKSDDYAKDYDTISKTYDSLWTKEMGKYTKEMLDRLDFKKGYRMLDLACGTGYIIDQALKTKPSRVIGIDNSEGMLNIAKKRVKSKAELISGDMLQEIQKLPDNSFDIVTCGWALAYVNKNRLIREIHRVLKKDGQVGIIVNRKGTIATIEDAFMKLMQSHPDKVKIINDIGFKLPKDHRHIRKLFEQNHLAWIDGWDKEQVYNFSKGIDAVKWVTECGALGGTFEIMDMDFTGPLGRILEEHHDNITVTHKFSVGIGKKC